MAENPYWSKPITEVFQSLNSSADGLSEDVSLSVGDLCDGDALFLLSRDDQALVLKYDPQTVANCTEVIKLLLRE